MNQKVALILSGGGMAASYNVGAVLALVEKYNFINPDIVIAGSGSAGTASYYVAGQYASIYNIWSNLLSTKKFINIFRFWKILNIDYLIDKVFKKEDPLDSKKIYKSNINYLIAVTNNNSGRVEYFSNKDRTNIFDVMRATKAVPILYGKKVKIKNKYYTDGVNSTSAEFNLLKACELGANKIIVVTCDIRVHNLFLKIWMLFKSKLYRQGINNDFNLRGDKIINSNILYIRPMKKIKVNVWNNNKLFLNKMIKMGYEDVINNKKIKYFLSNP